MDTIGSLSALAVFLEGVASFFSPCVVPLLPLYFGYMAGSARSEAEGGAFGRGRTLLHTACFVAGVSCAFFLLGAAFTGLGKFLRDYQSALYPLGGLLIVLLGLFQIGWLRADTLQRERKWNLPFRMNRMRPALAFLLGFSFSFAWTPCVGPALSSVLLLAAGSDSGALLIAVYTLGFVLPFLVVALFVEEVLTWLRGKAHWLEYVRKAGGVLLVLLGALVMTGRAGDLLPPAAGPQAEARQEAQSGSEDRGAQKAFDFTLYDQYGKEQTLSKYRGKIVFLNFWATWCPPCRGEMPHIEALYQAYGKNEGDVVVLGVAGPGGQEKSEEGIKAFLAEAGYTFPVAMDRTGAVFGDYAIRALPTTFLIDREGQLIGYVAGALDERTMRRIVEDALAGKRL